jgi:hypothetical protein
MGAACTKVPLNAVSLNDNIDSINVDGDPWIFKNGVTPPGTPNHASPEASSSAASPSFPALAAKRTLWETLTNSPASSRNVQTILDDYIQGDNVNGTILRLVDNGNSSLTLWATVEEGMLKYFSEKPSDLSVRPLGYVTLAGAKIKVRIDVEERRLS